MENCSEKSIGYVNSLLLSSVIDPVAARLALLNLVDKAEMTCPRCGESASHAQIEKLSTGGRAHCNNCSFWYGWSSGTIYAGTKLSPGQLWILACCCRANVDSKQASALADCHPHTAHAWYQHIIEATQ